MALRKAPHPEEAAKRPSRRTHSARPSKAVPRDLLDPVVEYFKPQRVILFGSRARGEATRESDIDLLVIVDDETPRDKLGWKAGYEAHRSKRAADVFPMRAGDFERSRHRQHPRRRGRRRRNRCLRLAERIAHEGTGPARAMECGRTLASRRRARPQDGSCRDGERTAFA